MSVFSAVLQPFMTLARPGRLKRHRISLPLSIGIVVPVFNEAAILRGSLTRLQRLAHEEEVVVVDGGSSDGSAQIASEYFRTEAASAPNRGQQLNRGAACLLKDVLLFLHADSQLPSGFRSAIRQALRDPRVAGGCFRLTFDSPRLMLHFYSWFTRLPGRFFHFGDQAFFVRREIFEKMGGYADLPFLEDVEFLRRLRRRGRFAVLPLPVITSARRFLKRGVVRQQLRNTAIVALFELGIPARRLARLYPHIR
jgi:rSAM/selenodomain-associated transferase 2